MLKRLSILLLAILLTGLIGSLYAQDDPATPLPPDDPSGLDGTPEPLPTRSPRPAPSQVLTDARATLTLYFPNLRQGIVGLAHVQGRDVTGATAIWLNRLVDFFPIEDDGLYGLLAVGMEQTPRRDYALVVSVTFADGTRETLNTQIEIGLGGFIRQEVIIPPDKGYLLDAETERNELARLDGLLSTFTPERYWDETGFAMPIPSALTSPFGAFRVFNSTLNTRHTGWDIRCTTGTPVLASAAGTVLFAGTLPIRGNHVIIDHGYGVMSGYSHLSVVNVTRGQTIAKGQVIGMTGSTGRTSGPHFHWEMSVNGEWIDSVQFLRMWMP